MGKCKGVFYDLQGHCLHVRVVNECESRPPPVRGAIEGFSPAAAARMRRYLRKCNANYKYMCTLTYPADYPVDGTVVKNHLRVFLQRWKRLAGDDSFSAFWFMEFQERGAPHFHIFCTHQAPKEWVADVWYEIVGSNDERHRRAGTRIEKIRCGRRGTCSYASKYASKMGQKEVPENYKHCGRFWGIHGDRSTMEATIYVRGRYKADPMHKEFRRQLRLALFGVKRTEVHPGHSIWYFDTDGKANEVKLLMLGWGIKLEGAGVAILDFALDGLQEE